MVFGRVGTAMVTPFDVNGNIDFDRATDLVNYLLDNGTDSLIVAGTTGESPTLTTEEKVALYRHVVEVVNGRVPVVAGTGSNNTRASIELTKKAEKAGATAVMLVAPYYNKPDQDGLYEHFKAIATETNLPVMIYNIPGRCSINISVDTIIKLSKVKNIVAVKEASGDLNAMAEIISLTDDDFYLYTGDDSNTLPVLSIGGRGVISVASHIIGNEMQEMISLFENGDVKKAALLHRRLLPIMKGLFIGPNPVPLKYALQAKGIDTGSVRLPLVPLQKEKQLIIDDLLKKILND
ncbi:dihydrodipicolinate synthase [Schinkia azotoformans MEV2011]|uniref:4-hydroxy-tetrahydrodipicolinate synthase n=1 Tax=Schinkia azotoformans MEV2011 TaxID=1348973 RepID=A0A072NRR5_SCHAZ|nr:4-hydroxy-tetrahydrodipicolinate synthase [Schinkia azotoformans]KEF39932.1 dihydrodipicolinate synthase [Schinkia azotoformans MEV2011]MEC1697231.1 4-hydroxy-tetrahydrodipicolinate synthase [Schinkia azotoformans]MEC1724270.1 4-hydroxy-tetrahydrodipicolinate synthase [Schinkia azotoformans]MEC1771474.1 4-hydroxy-tetrahydrodipicolinate synthase [Schinkia azotoformans]MED4367723.1 4-hydroxy-tetrahydrodipicolinate synthase [Schinkia azotoformans]